MCYAFTPVKTPEGIIWLPKKVLLQYQAQGKVFPDGDDWVFPGHRPQIFTWIDGEIGAKEMHWDLVPRFYLQKENLPVAEMLKRKKSRKQGGDGFSSYNARSESMTELASFRKPWAESKRMVVPVSGFRERPNEEDAPAEFRGREYTIHLAGTKNLAGIHDRWENAQGESLDSFTIITVDSKGNPLLESIYHPRCPLILDHAQVEEWLDAKTTPERAKEMIKLYSAKDMTLEEMIKPPSPPADPKPGSSAQGEQTSLF